MIPFRLVLESLTLDRDGNNLISSGQFVEEDPSSWGPIPGAPASEGRNLWYNYRLKDSREGSFIKAKCTHCHAADGQDLKYFNYSNLSIVERSIYHGLTRAQGERIASYIRNLSSPAPAAGRWRPWFS